MKENNDKAWGVQSYMDILNMDPLVFMAYLEQFKTNVNYHADNEVEMREAGNKLGEVADSYSFLSTLYTYAGVYKRQLGRNGKSSDYQDMIDKETALEYMLKTVDMEYRTLSKLISLYMTNLRETMYTDGIAGPKNGKR